MKHPNCICELVQRIKFLPTALRWLGDRQRSGRLSKRFQVDVCGEISDVGFEAGSQVEDRGVGGSIFGDEISLTEFELVEIRSELGGVGVRHEDVVACDEI